MPRATALAAAFFSVATLAAEAQTAREPRAVPGRDPGGVAVAIVGRGLDYNDTLVSSRLARDGEGDLIGWDFTDNDPRPYATGEPLAAFLAAAAPAARLVAVKVDLAKDQPHASAIGFLRATPARIVLLDTAVPFAADWRLVVRAAGLTPQFLYVVPAQAEVHPSPPPDAPAAPANVLIVAAPVDAREADSPPALTPVRQAAARAAALAANLLARETAADGAALKLRVLDEAKTIGEAASGWRLAPSDAASARPPR